jgi:hypothetical protein
MEHKLRDQDMKNSYMIDSALDKAHRKIKMKPTKSVKKVEMLQVIEEQKMLLREKDRSQQWQAEELKAA